MRIPLASQPYLPSIAPLLQNCSGLMVCIMYTNLWSWVSLRISIYHRRINGKGFLKLKITEIFRLYP